MLPVAKNQLTKYRAGMTAADPGAAAVGWRLVDGGTTLPANIGMNAEPEVYKALAAVVAAKDLPFLARGTEAGGLGNNAQNAAVATTFVRAHSDAWAAAIDVCTRVGVIK